MQKKQKVFWDETEKQLLIEAVANARLKYPDRSFIDIINGQIMQMPKERQRKIITIKNNEWIIEGVNKHIQELKRQAEIGKNPPEPQTIIKPVIHKVALTREEKIDSLTSAECLYGFMKKLEDKIDLLQKSIDSQSYKRSFVEESKPRKKRVLIVGLKNGLASIIKERYSKLLDLKIVDESINVINSMDVDAVFVMVNFVGHPLANSTKSRFGNKVRLIKGSISVLESELETLLGEPL